MHLYYLIRYAKRFNDKGKFTDRQLEVIAAELRSHESAADITPSKGSKLDKSKEKDPAQFNKYVKLMGDLTKKYTEAVKAVKKGDINKVIDIAKTYDKLVSKETEVYNKLINND
jgi:CRISPR/Cas system-associated endonuclease Cas3-HD